jgi:hypothetical protein
MGHRSSGHGITIALCLALVGCATSHERLPPVPPPAAATMPDVRVFLAPPDVTAATPLLRRRHDWPGAGYQISDAFAAADGQSWITTWSYPPFGPFVEVNGDGGEVYVTDGTTVRIAATQDGGKPYLQGFQGASCGGTGWVLFRNDAPTGSWAELVARLGGGDISAPCSADNPGLTRYRLEVVEIPFIEAGVRTSRTLPTVISEHFNNATLAKSTALERSFFAAGVGRVIWEAWTTSAATDPNLADRCPGTVWSTPPAPGWALVDCRTSTNVFDTDGSMSGEIFAWPPAGTILP